LKCTLHGCDGDLTAAKSEFEHILICPKCKALYKVELHSEADSEPDI